MPQILFEFGERRYLSVDDVLGGVRIQKWYVELPCPGREGDIWKHQYYVTWFPKERARVYMEGLGRESHTWIVHENPQECWRLIDSPAVASYTFGDMEIEVSGRKVFFRSGHPSDVFVSCRDLRRQKEIIRSFLPEIDLYL